MRPKQWAKNVFIFPALFFSRNLFVREMALASILTFGIFCLGSGAIYYSTISRTLKQESSSKAKSYIASGKLSPGVI
jgi:hypothetical protein